MTEQAESPVSTRAKPRALLPACFGRLAVIASGCLAELPIVIWYREELTGKSREAY
jgi:hypothetical protein